MEALYNKIGINYDVTRTADPEIIRKLAELLAIAPNKSYLDVACGTGNYTIPLSKLGGHWQGFDQSEKMLDEARSKAADILWSTFDVAHMGYTDGQFDGAICTLAIHHFPDLDKAFTEIRRVLKPQSPLVIFTSAPEQMQHYWLRHYFPKMMQRSCEQMPSLTKITQALLTSGFGVPESHLFYITPELQDLFLYSGKQRPELYLDSRIRSGISSFKNFCSNSELNTGLEKLKVDIASGEIQGIIAAATHNSDYLFLLAHTQP